MNLADGNELNLSGVAACCRCRQYHPFVEETQSYLPEKKLGAIQKAGLFPDCSFHEGKIFLKKIIREYFTEQMCRDGLAERSDPEIP